MEGAFSGQLSAFSQPVDLETLDISPAVAGLKVFIRNFVFLDER
jgi:hypothetical protein